MKPVEKFVNHLQISDLHLQGSDFTFKKREAGLKVRESLSNFRFSLSKVPNPLSRLVSLLKKPRFAFGLPTGHDFAQHLIHADNWFCQKLEEPSLQSIVGNARRVTITDRAEYDRLIDGLVETGERRTNFISTITDNDLTSRIQDGHYGPGTDSPVWWLILRANLDHEIHRPGALAVYLRVMTERS